MIGLCSALLASSANGAPDQCPFHEQGVYPWASMVPKVVDGDLWAWVYLDLDKAGAPLRCRIGEGNLSAPETRSNVCRNFVGSWQARPLVKDGEPVAGTTRRFFILMGRKHEKLFDQARARWMAAHPELRACYSDREGRGISSPTSP